MTNLETMKLLADDARVKQFQLAKAMAEVALWRQQLKQNNWAVIKKK